MCRDVAAKRPTGERGGRVTQVSLGQDAEICVLQLELVDPDRDVRPLKIRESTGVVKVEVAHDDSFDILDVVARLFDRCIKLLIFCIIDPGKDVV